MHNTLKEDKLVYIERGSSFHEVTRNLEKDGIIKFSEVFYYLSKIYKGDALIIKSGEYLFQNGEVPSQVLKKMIDGDVYYRQITFAEGLTNNTILKMIQDTPELVGDIQQNIPEGTLLPDTYKYSKGDTKESLIHRMQEAMNKVLDENWAIRDLNSPLKTKEEALTLASIVEKETGLPEERSKVASVFVNRLRVGMKIQSDPTVVYSFTMGNKELERPIRVSDLKRQSPYNTYYIQGLPPAPIANPGKESIKATLNPDKTQYLYFVATGNGGHNFATNLRQHINYVNKYRRLIEQIAKEQEENNKSPEIQEQ
jgi:UPF0755 protein